MAGVLGRLLGPGRTGARRGAVLANPAIGAYAILVGGQASVVWAAIMGGMVLLAGQGSAGGNPPGWLRRLDPQLALLSVSANDSRGLPDAEVIQALQSCNLLRTDLNGWIEVDTDGA